MRTHFISSKLEYSALIGFTLLVVAACSNSGTAPTPPVQTPPFTPSLPPPPPPVSNHNPVITALNVTDFGVSGLTTISMSAAATDEDNDVVSFRWAIGSGQTATGTSFSTILNGDGPMDVALTVTDSKGGSTTEHRTVNIGTMTGRWRFIPTSGNACGVFGLSNPPIFTLTQIGRVVTGDITSPSAWCNVPAGQNGRLDPGAPGSIDEQGNFKARTKLGSFLDDFLTAKMDGTGRELTGTATFQNYPGFSTFWLRKI